MPKRVMHRLFLGLCWLLAVPLLQAEEELFFRYENAEGVTVIDDHVPPQFAHKGYAVLNSTGRLVELVPRALTDAERGDPNNAGVQARLRAEEAERQRREDNVLLARYSSAADIEAAQTRRVNEIKVRINLLKGNVASLKEQLETRQAKAAEIERSGEQVPEEYPQTIEALRAEIAEAEAQIARHQVERTTTEMRYDLEIERFKVLRPEQPSPP
jgi:chromosome segregation ATPase